MAISQSLASDYPESSPSINFLGIPKQIRVRSLYREISYHHDGTAGAEWHVNFAGLHRTILWKLQEELIEIVRRIRENDHEITSEIFADLEPLMAKYTAAVRDWEFMIEHAEKTNGDISRDLFVASSAKWLGYTLMDGKGVIENGPEDDYQPQSSEWRLPGWQRRHMNAEKRQALEEENAKKQDAIDKENEAKEKKRKEQSLEARFRRFWMSGFAGIALVGPMLLMVLHRDQTTALATTSVAVVLFAIIIAIAARTASPEVAVGAVAAYAAVLVVFVGSALPPP